MANGTEDWMETRDEDDGRSRVPAAGRNRGGKRSWWWPWSLPLVGLVLGWFLAGVVAYTEPVRFESVAVVQIHGSEPLLHPFGDPVGRNEGAGAESIRTEVAVMTSEENLRRVAQRLDLGSRWNLSPDAVVDVLQGVAEVDPVEGTELVEIRVRHTSSRDACDIAEKVAEAYKERRVSMEMERMRVGLNALDGEMRDQEDLVEEKRKVLDTIVQALGIAYVEGHDPSWTGIAAGAEREAKELWADLDREHSALEAELKVLSGMAADEVAEHALVMEAVPGELRELRRELLIEQRVLEEMGTAEWDEAGMEMIRQRALVAVLDAEWKAAVPGVRKAAQTRLGLLRARVEAARSHMNAQRDDAVDRALESQDFVEARREYEAAQGLLQVMKKQHTMKRIVLKIPKQPITVHQEPMVGRNPVSPDVDRYLTIGKLGGAGIGTLCAVLVAGVGRGREREARDAWVED